MLMQTDLADAYSSSKVTVWDGETTITARGHQGARWGNQPDLVDTLGVSELYVITAWNPRSELSTEEANNQSNGNLLRDLQALGLHVCRAEGASVDGTWAEASFAVLVGGDEYSTAIQEQVHKLAIKYQQNAYFKLTSETFEVFGAIFTGLHISLDIEISMR